MSWPMFEDLGTRYGLPFSFPRSRHLSRSMHGCSCTLHANAGRWDAKQILDLSQKVAWAGNAGTIRQEEGTGPTANASPNFPRALAHTEREEVGRVLVLMGKRSYATEMYFPLLAPRAS